MKLIRKKMKKIRLILILLLTVNLTTYCQSEDKDNKVVGKWRLENIVSDLEVEEKLSGSDDVDKVELSFFADGNGFDHSIEEEFKYQISDNEITIGNRKYELIELTEEKLIIKEQPRPTSLSHDKLIFKKIDN